ncbi:MAG: glycerol-3-phosphate dehydrogenase/oxidase [Rubrivivax sp.]|nr:glycerol-3-phosphate dehydrogenase/oxidase [Rubrivivax sp.]
MSLGTAPDTSRAHLLAQARAAREWDLAVIGGGATGLGVALDAAARGFSVVLFESDDFAKGTSSRATKLVHGGVRYLAQGNVALVREALHERSTLLANAPHLAQPLAFVMPGYRWWERGFYGIGLKMYDALAGSRGLGPTEFLSSAQTRALLPTVRARGLCGGVKYWDGQFDDARLAVTLARTAVAQGAVVLNHCPVTALLRQDGKVKGVVARDALGTTDGTTALTIAARCVINATGVWVDDLRNMDRDPGMAEKSAIVAPSQGVHLVVDRAFLPATHALLVPKTADGRVLFAVPWLGKTILGTTDTPRDDIVREPAPFAEEVQFILREAGRYLDKAPTREDVRSVWVGLRPLVRHGGDDAGNTKRISREHTVLVGRSGLVTVTGGKWTTYRAMAEDVLEHCFERQLLPRKAQGVTARLPLLGASQRAGVSITQAPGEHLYGSEAALLHTLPGATHWLWRDAESGRGALSEAMVRFALRFEMARSVEDVLARRSRLLFLDAAEAARQAGAVAAILADELGAGFDAAASQAAFEALAAQYQRLP